MTGACYVFAYFGTAFCKVLWHMAASLRRLQKLNILQMLDLFHVIFPFYMKLNSLGGKQSRAFLSNTFDAGTKS